MNPFITARFHGHQALLLACQQVTGFTLVKLNVTGMDGRIRIRATLMDGGLLEFAEYLEVNEANTLITHSYAFHWQDRENRLIQRWDNVTHFPDLPNAPHHIHKGENLVEGNPTPPTLADVLNFIEKHPFG